MRVWTFVLSFAASYSLAQLPPAILSEADRVWLEEEVVYIITARERAVFSSLGSDEERRHFVAAFWRKRDPNPITPINEYREEHYRRLAHANTKLDDESLLPGWKTERGRMYITLGEPRSIERFSMDNRLVSTEIWFYEGDTSKGLPPFFNLIFFKRMDTGEFRLYSPTADGPAALLRGRFGVEPQIAVETINRVSPELARASLSIEARAGGDIHTGIASLDNETTMMRIEDSPTYAVRTDYLDAWERFGNRVAAEYSFNFVPSRSTFAVLPGVDGTAFLHVGVELNPEDFSVAADESSPKLYTTLDVSVEARTLDGTLVFSDDQETYIELTAHQLETIRMAPVAYQDSLPIVPGEYNITVISRNRVDSRFTVGEATLTVPSFGDVAPALSDVVVGYLVETPARPGPRTFQPRELRIHPSADRVFTQDERLHAMLQIVGASGESRVHLTVSQGGTALIERSTRIADYPDRVVHEVFPLSDMSSGDYELAVELVDEDGTRVETATTAFQISPRTAIPRPSFIVRRQFLSGEPGRAALARAEQLLALGQLHGAVAEFETAVAAANPGIPSARWKLAGAYNRMERPDRALELLLPMADTFVQEFDVSMGLGVAYYLQEDFVNAVRYFERAIAIRPPNASQWNAIGNSYVRLGRIDEARAAYERSLALEPSQKSVETALAALEKSS